MAYANITSNATTNIAANNQGTNITRLNRVVINKAGTTANTCTIWDGDAANGVKVATIDTTATGLSPYDYGGLRLTRGLTLVTATGVAGDITVVYNE